MPTVKDIMTKNVVSIGVCSSVFEAAELLGSNQVGCLVIKDGEVPIGIVLPEEILSEGSWRSAHACSQIGQKMVFIH